MALSTDRAGVAERWPGVHLSPMESALLAYLLAVGDRVVTADELLREVWGYHPKAKSTTVKSTVRRIRQKIESDPGRPQQLLALRGRGYQLVQPVKGGAAALSQRARSPSVVADPTRFVGRRADLERLHELLDQDRRLITVHGGPGLGKTRLVRELAPQVTDRFAGGVWFCDLSHTTDTEVAFGIVARVLGVVRAADATSSIVDALLTVLQARPSTLLILDNLEQLPHSAHQSLATLLGACPALHLLCTSRVRLQVSGEALHEVVPLAQDEGASLLRDRIDAIRLDRSRPLEESVLKDIHALLEGVPLALELAAARARVLPLRELRSRLTCSFAVLDGQRSSRPQRQQTLHQAIEWSWRLLSADEASALLQFGAFQSGCSLQVAEDVIQAQPSALDAITTLLDKSLLRSWQTEGQLRIGPYAYVREYLLEKGGQALEHARQRHAEWALGLVAHTAASLDADPQAGTVLMRELDNVLAAADWLVAAGRPEAADVLWNLRHLYYAERLPTDLPRRLRAARSTLSLSKEQVDRLGLLMARVFGLRGEYQRVAAEVERGLARVATSSALRSDLVLMQASMASASGDHSGAVALAEKSITLAEQFGTEETLVRHFNTLGNAHRHLEQHEAAVAACRKAVVEAERVGAERLMATPLSNMALSFRVQGDARRGLDCLRRAREVAERFRDARMAHYIQAQMAPLHAHLGELELADTLFQRVIADDQRFEQSNLGVGTRVNAGITALLCSDFERAASVLEDARHEFTDQGRRGATLAICLSSLMVCRAALDDLERAEQVAELLATIPPLELAPRVRLQLAISHGHLDLLRAVRSRERGDAESAAQYRTEAERRCALERDTTEGTGLELVRDLLQRALDRDDART